MAQSSGKAWRIGFLYFASRESAMQTGRYRALVDGLAQFGYIEGKDFFIEARYGDGKAKVMLNLATQLIEANVDVIVTGGTPAAKAAQRATQTVPIVFASSADPIHDGLVNSLAKPEANVTGVTSSNAEVDIKHVELIKTVLPKLSRIAVLVNPANPGHMFRRDRIEMSAAKVQIKTLTVTAEAAEEFEDALASAVTRKAQGLIILNDTFFLQNEQQISNIALKCRLPSICALESFADAGTLMSYGGDVTAQFRHAASYVDKIMKGVKPSQLPVEAPRSFNLVINLRTAKTLRLVVPSELRFVATRLIT